MSRSQTVKGNLLQFAMAGLHPGNYPLGYMRNALLYGPHAANPITAPAVVVAFKLRDAEYSLGGICKVLEAMGVRSARGKAISRQALHGILTNPFYMGMVRLNGRLYPGRHEPLVSAELFARVQATFPSHNAQAS